MTCLLSQLGETYSFTWSENGFILADGDSFGVPKYLRHVAEADCLLCHRAEFVGAISFFFSLLWGSLVYEAESCQNKPAREPCGLLVCLNI